MTDRRADLWWDARNSYKPNQVIELAKNVMMSLPGQPTKQVFAALALGRENAALAIDLNKYRTNRNLQVYKDAGVDIFILRIGGPGAWVDGAWQYTQDVTYRPYLEECDRIGVLDRTIGYIVHNPFESWSENGATGETIHTELIDDWTSGGYMPKAFAYDHEVATCWRGATEITCTPINLVRSLQENTANTYRKFRRMVGIYTARWFINKYALSEHITYLDNINKPESMGGAGKQRPMWYAWYAQTFSKTYTNLQDSLSDLLVPTTDQTNKLLQCGSYSLADLWQFTATLKLAGGMNGGGNDTVGVDASVSLGTLSEVCAAFGLGTGVTPPPDPDPDPEPEPDPELEARVKALEDWRAAIKAAS